MNYTRIYSDSEGESHFEIVEVPLKDNSDIGHLSDGFPVRSLQFRENKADYSWDFHHAPERQFIILLDGEIEITTSLGETRKFSAGDILLAEDITGKGHKTSNVKRQIRKSIFVQI
jgi:mannose-6-phosphate isomerase-like protein (cupin superfamily)